MNWQSSTTANGARGNAVKLGPKLSRLVCQNQVRKRELEKLILKKIMKRPPESYMPVFDNISTQLHCSHNNKSMKGILNILKN